MRLPASDEVAPPSSLGSARTTPRGAAHTRGWRRARRSRHWPRSPAGGRPVACTRTRPRRWQRGQRMGRRRARGRGDDDVLGPPSSASRRRFQRWVARSAANFSRSEIARRATIFRRRSIYSLVTDFSALGANETDRFTIENFCAKTSSEKPTQIAKRPTNAPPPPN